MPPDEKALDELVASTKLFIRRHEEALAATAPGRMLEAVDGLHQGLATTLAAEVARFHNALLDEGRTPPRTPGRFAQAHARLASGDTHEREAWAFTALGKRLAETEGALLHLRLTLSKGSADGPAGSAWARRVVGETTTVARTLAALVVMLDAWRDAASAAIAAHEGRAPPGREPRRRSPRDALRAARECLLSGVPEGAAPPLRLALHAGLALPVLGEPQDVTLDDALAAWKRRGADLPASEEDLRAADDALARGTSDPVLAWRLLDFVEQAVGRASMTKIPV